MSNYEQLEERFQRIKSLAKNMKQQELPNYDRTADTVFDEIDTCLFKTMQAIFTKYLVKQMSFEDANTEIEKIRLRYISDKQIKERNANINHEAEVKKRCTTELTKKLIHPEGMKYKEIFSLLFCDLIPALTDEVTGKKIREGAGYFLITGVGNLTDEEREELRRCYQ